MPELSLRARIITDLVSAFNRSKKMERKVEDSDYGVSEIDKSFEYPEYYDASIIDMGKFKMEALRRNNVANKWVILQLHGGGYVYPFRNIYRTMAGLYSEAGRGAAVVSVDYRVAPENPYPAAVEDALEAYMSLLSAGYLAENIILAGDSAGGGLCMALCHRLRKLGMPFPAGIIAMSPWTDLALTGPSYKENFDRDPVFGNSRAETIFDNPYAKDEELKNPEVSPLYGDFKGFPPTLIQVGSEEMLLSDSLSVADKLREAGVKLRFTEYEGMFHVFQMAGTIMQESKQAWAEVKRFLEEI